MVYRLQLEEAWDLHVEVAVETDTIVTTDGMKSVTLHVLCSCYCKKHRGYMYGLGMRNVHVTIH